MKKIATLAFTLMLAASLSFAQDTGGDKAPKQGTAKTAPTGKKATKAPAAKGHKGGKKGKKSSGGSTTPAPK